MNKKLLCAMLISAMSVNFAAPLISRADDIPEPTETQIAEETQAAEEIYVEEFSAAIDIPTDITDEMHGFAKSLRKLSCDRRLCNKTLQNLPQP